MQTVQVLPEPLPQLRGREGHEVAHRAHAELQERLPHVGIDVQPLEGHPAGRRLLLAGTGEDHGRPPRLGDRVGPEAREPHHHGRHEGPLVQVAADAAGPGLQGRVDAVQPRGVEPEEPGHARRRLDLRRVAAQAGSVIRAISPCTDSPLTVPARSPRTSERAAA